METKQVDVIGVFEALKTNGEAKLSNFASPVKSAGIDYSNFHPALEDMNEVSHIFKKIFDGKKSFGTDTAKMGFFHDCMLAAKVEGNQIIFAMPFNGPMTMLREILEKSHYNKTDSVMVTCDVNDDNTILTATFYSKEYKLFKDL